MPRTDQVLCNATKSLRICVDFSFSMHYMYFQANLYIRLKYLKLKLQNNWSISLITTSQYMQLFHYGNNRLFCKLSMLMGRAAARSDQKFRNDNNCCFSAFQTCQLCSK